MKHAARALAAIGLVALASLPAWPQQIDDLYITVAYAAEWLDSGVLRWTTGEVVEGYSNFLWLLAMIPPLVAGLDPGVFAKVLSFVATAGYLVVLSARAPLDARGHVLVFAVATWAPLAYWSVMGLETTAFAFLASAGWALCARSAGDRLAAASLLVMAAMTRPEGHAWLLLGAAGSWVAHGRGPRDKLAFVPVALLLVYHLVRVLHFGHVLPTPAIVKLGGAGPVSGGLAELAAELPTAVGIFACVALVRLRSPSSWFWVCAPTVLHAALVAKTGGDWMSHARLLLPGLLGSLFVLGSVGAWRESRVVVAVVAGLAAVGGLLDCVKPEDGGLIRRRLESVVHSLAKPRVFLESPMFVDVEFAVERIPSGGTLTTTDVGLIGNVPGVRVRDGSGLVDRASAEVRGGLRPFVLEEWLDVHGAGPGQVGFLRALPRDGRVELPPWLAQDLPYRFDVPFGATPRVWFVADVPSPPREVVNSRWLALAERFPAQCWLRWHAVLATADGGGAIDTRDLCDLPGDPFAELPASASFTHGVVPLTWQSARGFPLYWNGTLVSRPLRGGESETLRLQVDVDAPGSEGARVRVRARECEVERVVVAPVEWPIASLCPGVGPGDRLSVSFENDAAADGADRNVYVMLVTSAAR